ncbi:MAG: hypothetical protein SPL13_05220 [Clostridia bacterium]|nr:hypothetical protein [Clostridia bacterium]
MEVLGTVLFLIVLTLIIVFSVRAWRKYKYKKYVDRQARENIDIENKMNEIKKNMK